MVDAAEGTSQAYSADDFEGAVERLLGKRHKVLKELEATPAQICSAFSEAFFSGELSENAENCGGLISLDTSKGGKSTDRGVMYEP